MQLCAVFLARTKCLKGFTDYHGRAGIVISAGLALLHLHPLLTIKSLTQPAPPGLFSHAVYITAAERGAIYVHTMAPAVMQIGGYIEM